MPSNPPRFDPSGPRRRGPADGDPPPITVGPGDSGTQPPSRRPARDPGRGTPPTASPPRQPTYGHHGAGPGNDRTDRNPPPAIQPRGHAPAPPPATAPSHGTVPPPPGPSTDRPARRRRRRRRPGRVVLVVLLAVLLAWPAGLAVWANSRLDRVDALSGASDSPGTTYLLAGSDSRDSEIVTDATEGARTDTIMLLHKPSSGPTTLLSLPRDTYAEIPGHGGNKLNAAYTFGGAPLLVQTVEGLTGLTVDHYVEIGFDGVAGIVDAVDGVELCLDQDVNDWRSKLEWEAGCHEADGRTALAFARMRYSDIRGDIGRAERQQQLIQAVTREAADPVALLNPDSQVDLLRAGTDALVVSDGTNVLDLGRLALAFRAATGPDGVRGTPWIASADYRPGGIGSAVLLDDDRNVSLFADIRDGELEPGSTVGGLPGS